jgi:hypothetical protein
MIEKISTLISQIDWHVFAFLACFAIVAIFFAVSFLGGGKKLLESFNTKELLAALNRSEQDFDEEKERKVIDVLSIRQQRYVEALSSGRFNPRSFLCILSRMYALKIIENERT